MCDINNNNNNNNIIKNDDSFRLVLRSNKSLLDHPYNTASQFSNSWDPAIQLDPNSKWKVALTDLSFIYKPSTILSTHGIEYDKYVEIQTCFIFKIKLFLRNDKEFISPRKIPIPNYTGKYLKFEVNHEDGTWKILSPFAYTAEKAAPSADYEVGYTWGDWINNEIGDGKFGRDSTEKLDSIRGSRKSRTILMKICLFDYHFKTLTYTFPNDMTFQTVAQLAKYFNDNLKPALFNNVSYKNKRISFQMGQRVKRIRLLNELNFVLGFEKIEFFAPEDLKLDKAGPSNYDGVFNGNHDVQLNRGHNTLYIQASCVAPTYIDNVPSLLTTVAVEKHPDKHGLIRQVTVHHPKYVNVAASFLNRIDIKVCNATSEIIHLPEGATTCMVLHFMRL